MFLGLTLGDEAELFFWGGGHIGIVMEKKLEATIVYWGYKGRMDKKMETTREGGVENPQRTNNFRFL